MNFQAPINSELLRLTTLIALERGLRAAKNRPELAYTIVNETHDLVRFDQAVLLARRPKQPWRITAVSNAKSVDLASPLAAHVLEIAQGLSEGANAKSAPIGIFSVAEYASDASDIFMPSGFYSRQSPSPQLEVMFIAFRASAFDEGEQHLLGRVAECGGHAWQALGRSSFGGLGFIRRILGKPIAILAGAAVVAAMFYPVTLTTRGSAQIAPKDAFHVRAPYGGVVEAVHVRPNQSVEVGTLLVSLDAKKLMARAEIVRKAGGIARAEFRIAAQQGLGDPRARAELATLQGRIRQHEDELSYIASLLARLEIRAPKAGVVLFNDANEWIGRPVQTGERILLIAEPNDKELIIELPINNAIAFEDGATVTFQTPRHKGGAFNARIIRIGYDPIVTADGVMAYFVTAELDANAAATAPLGARGTALIEGGEAPLFMQLFRRPLTMIRQWLVW